MKRLKFLSAPTFAAYRRTRVSGAPRMPLRMINWQTGTQRATAKSVENV